MSDTPSAGAIVDAINDGHHQLRSNGYDPDTVLLPVELHYQLLDSEDAFIEPDDDEPLWPTLRVLGMNCGISKAVPDGSVNVADRSVPRPDASVTVDVTTCQYADTVEAREAYVAGELSMDEYENVLERLLARDGGDV